MEKTWFKPLRWNWDDFWEKPFSGLISVLRFALGGGLILMLIGAVAAGLNGLLTGLFVGLISALIFGPIGLIVGLFAAIAGAIVERDKEEFNLSPEKSAAFILGIWLIGGLIGGLIGILNGALITGLFFGLFFGLIAGLNRGGSVVVKHYALRLILWFNGYTPLMFVKFLDHCAKLILLKKVGGSYIFIHRMLLEYFAGMTSSRTEGKM